MKCLFQKWYNAFVGKQTKTANFLKHIEGKIIRKYYKNSDYYITADPMTMAIALNYKAVVKEEQLVHCDVETSGKHSRGAMLITWPFFLDGVLNDNEKRTVHLIVDINRDAFCNMLYKVTD